MTPCLAWARDLERIVYRSKSVDDRFRGLVRVERRALHLRVKETGRLCGRVHERERVQVRRR